MARRFYSLKINTDKRPTQFQFGVWWHIIDLDSFNKAILLLRRATAKDKTGRVLCYGSKPAYTLEEQKRIYVVKMGHDGKLWDNFTSQGQLIRQHFKFQKVRR